MREWVSKSGKALKKFFNTSGNLYKELNLKERLPNMTDDEQIKLLSTDGMMIKRPILIGEDVVLIGFIEEEWKTLK